MRRAAIVTVSLLVACGADAGGDSLDPLDESVDTTGPAADDADLRRNRRRDAGTSVGDSGVVDSSTGAADGGAADSGVGANDSGILPDAGAPLLDSGANVVDSGTVVDAGAPPPPPPPPPSDCLSNVTKSVIAGAFTSQYSGQPANGSTVDARSASWSMNDGWLSTPKASTNVCWVGGEYSLTIDDTSVSPTEAWANIWHHDGGQTLKYNNAGWTFDAIAIRHVGDAFNLSTGAQDFTIRNSHISDVRDDCVQNDDMHAGNVYGNFFDGCYVGFSARASAGDVPNDGHLNVWAIHDNVIWIKPMRSVYKGDSPGNGQLIKWEKTNPQLAPKLSFKNNVVRIGKLPFQTGSSGEDFYVPPGTDFSNNTLYWDGAGSAPASLAAWFNAAHSSQIVYSSGVWDAAVANWKAAHPGVK